MLFASAIFLIRDGGLRYGVPVVFLLLVTAVFLLLGLKGYAAFAREQKILAILVAMPLLVSAIYVHFLRSELAASIIPPFFPHPVFLVYLSGIFELAAAFAFQEKRLRRVASLLTALMLASVFPANIYVAGKNIGGLHMPSVPVRLAMQVVYLLLVLLAGFGLPRVLHSQSTSKNGK
jgi:uncharacterized membrane protein